MHAQARRQRGWWIAGLVIALACGPEGAPGPSEDGSTAAAIGTGHFQMENLGRGVVAVQVSNGVYVGWRMFGYEYDPSSPSAVSYDVYRNGTRIASVTNSTNYLDTSGTSSSTYSVRAIVNGTAQPASSAVAVLPQNYLRIPLQIPAGGTTSSPCSDAGTSYTYSANDGSVGDLDGDGEYEIVLKWDPSNAKDNSQSGCTGNVYLDAYKLTGTRLWRIDLGRNIRAGAHYTQFVVYDFDGDGKAELAVKTAPGTRDGTGAYLRNGPAASDNDSADYRNSAGYVLSGPEYLTVFAGPNGAELATVNFDVGRGTVSSWGDSYGNRVDRFLASAAFVSDAGGGSQSSSGRPSILMARGYYTRATVTAWNWRDGRLTQVWKADSDASTAYTGQGAHTMAVADSDGDGAQEIMYGASVIDSNGTRKCTTNFGHGDALHVGAFVPGRSGVQVFMPHEDGTQPSWSVHDGSTCQVLQRGPVTGTDTGRGVAGDVYSGSAGAEVWANNSSGLISAASGANVGSKPASANFLVWWDADESRELEDGTSITKYGGSTLLTASGCASNNGTKSTPVLVADLLGDWREEVIWRESNDAALRVYTTTAVTSRRLHTLMHDPQYRMQVSSEQTAYNQPPHPSFAIGSGMAAPPRPNIYVPGQAATTYTVTIAAVGSGTTSPAPGSYTYAAGSSVTVTAIPTPNGATFAGWSGAASGTANPVTLTVNGNLSLTATFAGATTYTLGVTKAGTGSGTVTSTPSGISCGASCTASYLGGTVVTLDATPASGSTFAGWGGACTGTGACVASMTAARSVTATFDVIPVTGAVSVNVGGSATGAFVADTGFSGGSTYTVTTAVDTSQLTGTVPPQAVLQSERYGEFTYTLGGFTAGSAQTVTLYFAEVYWTAAGQRTFHVAINGAAALSAFDIFTAAGGAGKAIARTFSTTANASGQVVVAFTKGGGPDNPKVCGIAVAPAGPTPQYTLTVTKAGTGDGTVSGGGIDCGATCSASLDAGTAVTLTATAAANSTFYGWSGHCGGTTPTCVLSMSGARSVTATFHGPATSAPLTVTKDGTGAGTVSGMNIQCGNVCSYIYSTIDTVALTATAASGSKFTGWSGDCTGTSAVCSVAMTGPRTVTATFDTVPVSTCKTPAGSGQSGNFETTGAVCYTVSATIHGWGCSNADGRTVTVNGVAVTCGQTPLPGSAPYTFSFGAGAYPWASFYWW